MVKPQHFFSLEVKSNNQPSMNHQQPQELIKALAQEAVVPGDHEPIDDERTSGP